MTFIQTQARLLSTERRPFVFHPQMDAKSTGAVLLSARKQRNITQKAIGSAVGVTYAAVGQWERGVNLMTMDNLQAVCRVLGIEPVAASRGELVWLDDAAELERADVEQITPPGRPALGPKDVPVSGVVYGGDGEDEDFIFEGRVIDYVRRPPGIEHVSDVFALHVLNNSMYPRYGSGDVVYAGGRAPLPGDDVVIEFHPAANEIAGKGLIKTLVRRSARLTVVSQFNPAREIELDTSKIRRMTRVIPVKELLGF